MGMKDYNVILLPRATSPLINEKNPDFVEKIATSLQAKWPYIKSNTQYKGNPSNIALVYLTSTDAFEILIVAAETNNPLTISMRFDYCNPRDVYNAFCEIIRWLMCQYHMTCQPMRELALDEKGKVIHTPQITNADLIDSILIPSMDYKRDNWIKWAGPETTSRRLEDMLKRLHEQVTP